MSRRTASRYINGQLLPKPARLVLLSQILGVLTYKLYPEYYLDYCTRKKQKHGEWRNFLIGELTARGWDTMRLAKRCRISFGRAHNLVSWHYPPTEKILRKLEKGLRKNRSEFWIDWELQQRWHLTLRKVTYVFLILAQDFWRQ